MQRRTERIELIADRDMTDLPAHLPASFAATRESLRTLACYVIAPARKARTGRIGLRATGNGFGTPRFEDGTRITVSGDLLAIDPGDRIPITTLRAAARFIDISLTSDPAVGTDLPPYAPDDDLMVDADASRALGAWYTFADRVLRDLAATETTISEPQLWPEHFDLAAQLDLDRGTKVNVGFSPGDHFCAKPYVYVGPHDTTQLADEFWNAPFGALLGYDELTSTTSPEHQARAFLAKGLDLLRTSSRPRR
ncbi:MAG TPA: hypothetical protein VFV63_18315 [Ilumatobacteraceae bacterium]|nr:hypothetical protein [Ilumatobacteraceae bacterium]